MRAALLPALLLGLLTAGACASAPPAPVPPTPAARAPTIPTPAWVPEVRRALRAEDRERVFALLDADRHLDVDEPERAWLIAQLAGSWCASQRVRWDVQGLPRGDVGDALRAVVSEDPERAIRRLLAGGRGPEAAWRDLAASHVYGRLGLAGPALAAATRATQSPRAFVQHEAWLMRGQLALGEGGLDEAMAAARRAALLDPTDARPPRLEAGVHQAAGRLDDAARALLRALEIAPESPRYALRLAAVLREPVDAETWAAVDRSLPTLPDLGAANAELLALRALAAEHAGRGGEAIERYRQALAAGAIPVPLDRDLRRMLFKRGRYEEGLALLIRAVPPDVIADPRNLLRARWGALAAARPAAPDASAPPAARLALAQALWGVGALDEAMVVADGLTLPGAQDLRRRVGGHLAFERALRQWIEDGYRSDARKESPPDWQAGLRHMQRLAGEHLVPEDRAAFADPARGARELPLLGAWLDHGAQPTSPVVAHFRRYGRFILYGQRADAPVEAIVLSLASLTDDEPIRTGGRTYTHDVATGYDRAIRGQITAQGGGLGGACLADGIWLDADAARQSEYETRALLAWDPGQARIVKRSGALTADTLDGATALTDPGCTAGRLVARYIARVGDAPWGSFGTLRAHEFGHVRDIRRHLPMWPKMPNTVGLVVRHGFSFDRVQMELEYRAQLVACAEAPDPDLALAEMLMVQPVQQRSPEVHDGGYRDALGALVRHIQAHPRAYPQVDPRYRILTQLDRLTNQQIRAAARAVLQD